MSQTTKSVYALKPRGTLFTVNINDMILIRSVEVNKKGIYFAFRDEGACISLLAIKVFIIIK